MKRITVLMVLVCLSPVLGFAQGWDIDARTIGLAGAGGAQNIFATSVAEARGDRTFTIPLGLFQTLRNLDVFKPRSETFDPLQVIELGSNPLHLQFGRAASGSGAAFVHDIRNASLSRDLNDYRGFVPQSFAASGLIAPKWGHSFTLRAAATGLQHSLYVGAGPHLALQTRVDTDQTIAALLGAAASSYVEHAQFHIGTQSAAQLAAAITGGYRGRLPFGSTASKSAFFSLNVSYLQGLRLEDIDLGLHIETDAAGRLASDGGAPLAFDRKSASSGRGMSMDVGVGAVIGPWEIGASANNLAHRMTWRGVTYRHYAMPSLFSGDARVVISPAEMLGNVRSTVPTDYRGNLSYASKALTVRTEVAREWDTVAFRGGLEHSRGRLQLRAATAFADDAWHPTAGVSVAMSRRVWLDLAGFTTFANVERQRRYALASSIRIGTR